MEADTNAQRAPSANGATPDAEAVALRFYEPLRSGDTSSAAEFLADDWEDVPLNDGQTPGPGGFAEMVGNSAASCPTSAGR